LSAIETELDLFTIPLSAFNDIKLTTGELKGLMIMIAPDPSLTEHLLQDPSSFHRTVTASPSH
jgi:hypothetical protein